MPKWRVADIDQTVGVTFSLKQITPLPDNGQKAVPVDFSGKNGLSGQPLAHRVVAGARRWSAVGTSHRQVGYQARIGL